MQLKARSALVNHISTASRHNHAHVLPCSKHQRSVFKAPSIPSAPRDIPGHARGSTRFTAAQRAYASSSTPIHSEQADPRYNGLKVLVAGATGGVGRNVVEVLQELGVPVKALVRDAAAAQSKLSSTAGVEVVQGNVYQYATLPKAFQGCNAVIVATGATDPRDPFGPFNIDYQGTLNLISVAKRAGVKKFVLVTSIGADDNFNFLNLFWGVLFWKKQAEQELQRSGLSYTIVRPGGLKNALRQGESQGNIVMAGPSTYGVPPLRQAGSILRRQVAHVCVAALVEPSAADLVVEVIAEPGAPARSMAELFASVAGQ